jgi:transcriptional regulator GlxA family with amidase domain
MHFGIVAFEQAEELDFIGPWELVGMWHKVAAGPRPVLVGERTTPVRCAKGLTVVPDVDFVDCPRLDWVLVPGGFGTRKEAVNPAMLAFLRRVAPECRHVLSVCTGSFVLHGAGLLSGRRATTHYGSLDRMRALGDVAVVEERFVKDGNVWTAAGVSAGLDMTLALVAEVAGEAAAGKVQLETEYVPSGALYGGIERDPRAPRYVREG